MLCVCCLLKTENRKEFCPFTNADHKLLQELTKLEIKRQQFKICKKCKAKLKESTEFYRMCLKSYEQLSIFPAEQNPLKRKCIERKLEQELGEVDDEVPAAESSDDELPISRIKQQLQEEKCNILTNMEPIEVSALIHTTPKEEEAEPAKLLRGDNNSATKSWSCQECDKVFATKFRLKAHTRIHTGERPFVCEICSLSFAQGNALTCHRRVHTKERPFVCKICSKSFSQNTTLKTHMAALHLGKSIECDEPGCDKKFTRRSYLLIHKRDHAGERKYACDRCPNQYKQKSHLDRHIEASHLGIRHRCDFPGCSSEFSKAWSLKMHKFIHTSESEQLPYKCNLCEGVAFQRRDKLLKHRTKAHPEAGELKSEPLEIQQPIIGVTTTNNLENPNYVVLTSPEIYTIQNSDGTFTQVQTFTQTQIT